MASLAVLTWSRYCKRCVLVEEKEAEFIGSSSLNSYMGFAWCLSIQSHHCCFMGCHVCCYFTVPLWQHSQVSPQVTIVNPSLFLSSLLEVAQILPMYHSWTLVYLRGGNSYNTWIEFTSTTLTLLKRWQLYYHKSWNLNFHSNAIPSINKTYLHFS